MSLGGSSTTAYALSASFVNSSALITVMVHETPKPMLRLGKSSFFKFFSYIDHESGEWVIFNTDLKKPRELVYKRKADD